jgi:predicted ATP-binding protein involved in virulence
MLLKSLTVQNFRCFSDCSVDFHPELTVLVSRNGQGKTTLLDATAIALAPFVKTISQQQDMQGLQYRDIRQLPDGEKVDLAEVHSQAEADDGVVSWSRSRRGDTPLGRTSIKDTRQLLDLAQRQRTHAEQDTASLLPFVGYYGTGRRWVEAEGGSKLDFRSDRYSGYDDCLAGNAAYTSIVAWYRRMFEAAGSKPVFGEQPAAPPERLLAAVNSSVKEVLQEDTGWGGLHWDREQQRLCVEHATHGVLPLSFLSDGIRNTAVLVADVAHRCARLNPHLGEEAAQGTHGLLMIDEVDLHLHPEWQQTIVGALRRTFPQMQLVLSTHSPQVLSSIDVASIRIFRTDHEGAMVTAPKFQTRGVESADVLSEIMGVDPVPAVAEAKLYREYRALIDDGMYDSPEALPLRDELVRHFGVAHPLMLDADRLIRFTAFQRERTSKGRPDA